MKSRYITTDLATLEYDDDGILVVRVKEEGNLTVAGLAAVLAARKALAGGVPVCCLGLVPAQLEFDPRVVYTDHHEGEDAARYTRAMALVVADDLVKKLTHIYLKYRNPDFPVQLFQNEAEARAWLQGFMGGSAA
jgi:hypothetical protein